MDFIVALVVGHSVIGTVSVLLNAFLLISIILFTPKHLRAYSILMGATALWDLIEAASCLMCMARFLVLETHIVLISHGPCGLFSTRLCFLSFEMYLSCTIATYYTNLTSFGARLMILRQHSIGKRKIVFLLMTCVVWHNVMLFIIAASSQISDDVAIEIAARNVPDYTSAWATTASDSLESFTVTFTIIQVFGGLLPVYIGIWLFRVVTIRSLKRQAGKMSSAALKNHHRIVKILTLQSLTPLIPICSSLIFIFRKIIDVRNPLFETSSLLTTEVSTVLGPIIVFMNLPVYRRVIQRMFRCSKLKIHDSDHAISDEDQRRHIVRVNTTETGRTYA